MRDVRRERILAHGERAGVVGVPGGDVAEVGLLWPLTACAWVGLGVACARVGASVPGATGRVAGLAVRAVRSAAGRVRLRVVRLAVILPGPAVIGAGGGCARTCGLAMVVVRLAAIAQASSAVRSAAAAIVMFLEWHTMR